MNLCVVQCALYSLTHCYSREQLNIVRLFVGAICEVISIKIINDAVKFYKDLTKSSITGGEGLKFLRYWRNYISGWSISNGNLVSYLVFWLHEFLLLELYFYVPLGQVP